MAIIKKQKDNKCWQVCEKFGTLANCWWECKIVASLETVWRFPKIKIKLSYDSAISFLGIYPKEMKLDLKETDINMPIFIEALFIVNVDVDKLKCQSTDEWKKPKKQMNGF